MTDLSVVASRLNRAADLLEKLATRANLVPGTPEGVWWTADELEELTDLSIDHCNLFAALDPRTVAPLVPLLRHAAAGATRGQYDALSTNERRMVDGLAAFAARLLREEDQ